MAPSYDNLHLASSRRSTFHKNRKGEQTKKLNWPYPLTVAESKRSTIHPDHLALAGFYSTPLADDPTVTTCFSCQSVVAQWEEGEDPLYRHLMAAEESFDVECSWAVIQQASWANKGGLDAYHPDEWDKCWGRDGELHPRGEIMERARRGTFKQAWPHHGKKGVPTADEIAAAGWYFAPTGTEESFDKVDCPYCCRSVEGWVKGDDPVALHNRKFGVNCPFFVSPLPESSKPADVPKPKRGKASTAPGIVETSTTEKEKKAKAPAGGKKGKKVIEELVLEDTDEKEEEEPEVEVVEEEAHEPQPRTRATRSASVSTVATAPAPAPVRQSRRAKATPAPSEDEAEIVVAAPILKKSTRSRTTTATAHAPTSKASTRTRTNDIDVDVDVEVEVTAPKPPNSTATSSTKSSKKSAVPTSTSSKSSTKSKTKKVVSPTVEPEVEDDVPEVEEVPQAAEKVDTPQAVAPAISADESITDLAMIANAAYELQPSSTEETEVKKPAKKSKSKSKASKSSVASSGSSKAKGKGKVETIEKESPPEMQAEENIPEPSPVEAVAPPRPTPPTLEAQAPSRTTSPAPADGRQIRSLPSKVNPSKSPSSTSLSSKLAPPPQEAVPPVPSVSLASPVPAAAAAASPSSSQSLLLPPQSTTTNTTELVDNPFAPQRLLSLLPAPTPQEMSTLTVREWYELVASRIQQASRLEHERLHRSLEERIEQGRTKLEEMCKEAKEREEKEDRVIEEKRKAKKKQLQASARKQQGSARKAVR